MRAAAEPHHHRLVAGTALCHLCQVATAAQKQCAPEHLKAKPPLARAAQRRRRQPERSLKTAQSGRSSQPRPRGSLRQHLKHRIEQSEHQRGSHPQNQHLARQFHLDGQGPFARVPAHLRTESREIRHANHSEHCIKVDAIHSSRRRHAQDGSDEVREARYHQHKQHYSQRRRHRHSHVRPDAPEHRQERRAKKGHPDYLRDEHGNSPHRSHHSWKTERTLDSNSSICCTSMRKTTTSPAVATRSEYSSLPCCLRIVQRTDTRMPTPAIRSTRSSPTAKPSLQKRQGEHSAEQEADRRPDPAVARRCILSLRSGAFEPPDCQADMPCLIGGVRCAQATSQHYQSVDLIPLFTRPGAESLRQALAHSPSLTGLQKLCGALEHPGRHASRGQPGAAHRLPQTSVPERYLSLKRCKRGDPRRKFTLPRPIRFGDHQAQ